MEIEQQFPIDYYVTVQLSDDKLNAYLHFNDPDGSLKCSLKQLEELLRKHYIQHGVRYDVLADICKDPKKYFLSEVLVASGDEPKDGADGIINYKFDLAANRKPTELEDGSVDFKEMLSLNNVRKGQMIAEKIPPQDGTPGKAVTGEMLFPRKGKEARFKIGKNVVLDNEQTVLYAAIDGLVTLTDRNKINVFPVYEVNGDVDYNIGNIDFVGNVVVRGNVLTGFRIKADGDIRVVGGVEGAELLAGGSIEITAGILGHNKGLIKARKNVKSSFIQDGNIEAGEDVVVSQSIMHSRVRAGRDVICKGAKGLIVGGVIQAGERVFARTIGNSMSTVTSLEVGVLPELRNELVELRQQIKELAENMDKTEKALAILDQFASAGQLSPDKMAMRIKLGNSKKMSFDQLTEMKERMLEIEKSLEDTSKAQIEVISTIYSGAKIVIGRYTRFIKDPTQRVCFNMIDGEIAMISKHS